MVVPDEKLLQSVHLPMDQVSSRRSDGFPTSSCPPGLRGCHSRSRAGSRSSIGCHSCVGLHVGERERDRAFHCSGCNRGCRICFPSQCYMPLCRRLHRLPAVLPGVVRRKCRFPPKAKCPTTPGCGIRRPRCPTNGSPPPGQACGVANVQPLPNAPSRCGSPPLRDPGSPSRRG